MHFPKKNKIVVLISLLVLGFQFVFSQVKLSPNSASTNFKSDVPKIFKNDNPSFLTLAHRDASKNDLPYFLEKHTFTRGVPSLKLENVNVRELNADELSDIKTYKQFITNEFEQFTTTAIARGENIVYQKITPIRFNNVLGKYEFLLNYTAFWQESTTTSEILANKITSNSTVANTSVLSTGKWYKIGVTKNGAYKLSKSFLTSLGIDVTTIDPKNIRVYGNGGKSIPEKNASFRNDDLIENAVYVSG